MIMQPPPLDFEVNVGPQVLEHAGISHEQFEEKVRKSAFRICEFVPDGELWGTSWHTGVCRMYLVMQRIRAMNGTRDDFASIGSIGTWCDQIDRGRESGIETVSII